MRRLIPLLFCLTACISGGQRPSTTSVVQATSTGTSATETENVSIANQQGSLAYAKNPTVNVYLETSGSMNGYVDNGKTQFQQVVFDFLSNIKNSGLPSEMNLNYINEGLPLKVMTLTSSLIALLQKGFYRLSGTRVQRTLQPLSLIFCRKQMAAIFPSLSPTAFFHPVPFLARKLIWRTKK